MNRYTKAIKIASASTVAIFIAYSIGLNYAISAGIVTLLTLQNTKKETVQVALKRIIAFFMAALIAWAVFTLFAYNPFSFGIFLLFFVAVSYYFNMYDAVPINAVLATHYLLEGTMTPALVADGALLLVVGGGTGILFNLFIPANTEEIKSRQQIIEKEIKILLQSMADTLRSDNRQDGMRICLQSLEQHIAAGIKQAYDNMNNTFFKENRYYIEYMEMRRQQYQVLREIYNKINELTARPAQAYDLAGFISNLSYSLSESNNAKSLLVELEELLKKAKASSLPITREEFENRAVLYMILMDFRLFLKMKESFAESLTSKQKEMYWEQKVTIESEEKN